MHFATLTVSSCNSLDGFHICLEVQRNAVLIDIWRKLFTWFTLKVSANHSFGFNCLAILRSKHNHGVLCCKQTLKEGTKWGKLNVVTGRVYLVYLFEQFI